MAHATGGDVEGIAGDGAAMSGPIDFANKPSAFLRIVWFFELDTQDVKRHSGWWLRARGVNFGPYYLMDALDIADAAGFSLVDVSMDPEDQTQVFLFHRGGGAVARRIDNLPPILRLDGEE